MSLDMTHKNLCDIAVRWLKKTNINGGPCCHVAVSEMQGGWSGEIPDAIGFRAAGYNDGAIIVEVKVSRSDFLADRNKPHRNGETLGMGKWRFYLCPEGMIKPDEVPEKWGLVYVTKRGGTKCVKGFCSEVRMSNRNDALENDAFESDRDREMFLLVKLLSRLGDIEQFNQKLREMYRIETQQQKRINELKDRLDNSVSVDRKHRQKVLNFIGELQKKDWESERGAA